MPSPPPRTSDTAPYGESTGIDWNPISWATSAWNDATGVATEIKRWVIKQVALAVGFVENDIHKGIHYLESALDEVGQGIPWIINKVNSLADSVWGDITSSVKHVLSEAERLAHDAVAPVIKAVDTAWHHADNLFHSAEHVADSAINWFYDHTVRPALHDVYAAIHDVEKGADKALHEFELYVVKPIEHDASEALHEAHKAVYFIDHSALDAIHLIDETYDWLNAFRHHPMKSVEALPKALLEAADADWATTKAEDVKSLFGELATQLESTVPQNVSAPLP